MSSPCQDEKSISRAPKVLVSVFLSPGGPKFVALMLHLAKHVMLQEMKTFTNGKSFTEMQMHGFRPPSSHLVLFLDVTHFHVKVSSMCKYCSWSWNVYI